MARAEHEKDGDDESDVSEESTCDEESDSDFDGEPARQYSKSWNATCAFVFGLVVVAAAIVSLLVYKTYTSSLHTNGVTVKQQALSETSDAFIALAQRTYETKEGIMYMFKKEDCIDLTGNGLSCFANNPSSPYGLIMLPPPNGEYEDWSLCGTVPMPLCKKNVHGDNVTWTFHMKETEAVVLLGMTPPEVSYFGFANYVYEHTYPDDFKISDSVTGQKRCWKDGSHERRCDVFASLGDALNQGNLQPNSTEESIYGQPFAMVISASQAVYNDVEATLRQAGMSAVNLLPLPGEFLNLGFGDGKDTIANLLRTAFPSDRPAYEDWLEAPFFVFRLTARASVQEPSLFSKPEYCDPSEGIPPQSYCLTTRSVIDEASRNGLSMVDLKDAQSYILDKIADSVRPRHSFKTDFTAGVPDCGYICLELGQKCQGDSRDTYYPASVDMETNALRAGVLASKAREAMGLPGLTPQEMADWSLFGGRFSNMAKKSKLGDSKEDAMLVVGVVHSAAHASEYSSLTVYDYWKLQGVMSVPDADMIGSAESYLKGTKYSHLAPFMYVLEFTRGHCDGRPFCKDVPSSGDLSVPIDTPLLFIERMYYDNITHVGIDPVAATAPRVIHVA